MFPESITHVAIQFADGTVVSLPKPHRHGDIVKKVATETGWQPGNAPICGADDVQGFLTSTGRFVNREEAMLVASTANQILPSSRKFSRLYSEDLW